MKLRTVEWVPGQCYQASMEFLLRNFQRVQSLRLVHGYPVLNRGRKVGQRFGHAWLELIWRCEEKVIDVCNQTVTVPKEVYYAVGKIEAEKCHVYTVDEAIELMEETKHCGPWVKSGPEIVFAKRKRHVRP